MVGLGPLMRVVFHLGLPTTRGGIVVEATLRVPERPDVFAFGDSPR